MAAASIGQTHRARLHDGRAVVVKLQRPGLDDIVLRDSAVLTFRRTAARATRGGGAPDRDPRARRGTDHQYRVGAVGRIDPISREALQGIALGFSLRDGSLIARAVRHLVGDHRHIDMRQLERDMSVLLGEIQAAGFGAAAMAGVIDVIERHGLRPPRSMLLLSRTLITLEGTLNTLDPGFDLGSEAEQIVARDHREDLGTPEEIVKKELIRALPALRTLPEHAEAIGSQWRAGRMVVRTERYTGRDRAVVETWLNRTLVAIATAAGALTSATLLVAGSLSPDKGVRDVIWTFGFSGLTGTTVLLMRTVAQALHALVTRFE